MSKMKLLQPEMVKIRERFKDDRTRMNQEVMALYKKGKSQSGVRLFADFTADSRILCSL